jgi:predicted DNA-binding ribbon-helix-helix protein
MSLTAMSTEHAVEQRTTNSRIIKRSIIRNGHKSSVSLEDQFWDCLREIAKSKKLTVSKLVEEIDHHRSSYNLSSAIRLFVLEYYRKSFSDRSERSPGLATPG